MGALETILARLGAVLAGLEPEVAGPWRVYTARPGTYGYHSVVIDDGRKVAAVLEKWPQGAADFIAEASPANVSAVLEEVKRLRGRVDELLAANNREVERRRKVEGPARKLYLSGRWSAGLPANLEARLWEDLRDGLGLEPGTATAAAIGSDPAEPAFPFLDRPGREL